MLVAIFSLVVFALCDAVPFSVCGSLMPLQGDGAAHVALYDVDVSVPRARLATALTARFAPLRNDSGAPAADLVVARIACDANGSSGFVGHVRSDPVALFVGVLHANNASVTANASSDASATLLDLTWMPDNKGSGNDGVELLQLGTRLFVLRSSFVNGSAIFVYELLRDRPRLAAVVGAPPGAFKPGSRRGSLVASYDDDAAAAAAAAPSVVYWVDGGFVATLDVQASAVEPLRVRAVLSQSEPRAALLAAGFVSGDDDDGDQLFIPAAHETRTKTFSTQVFSSGIAAASGGRLVFVQGVYLTLLDVQNPSQPKVLFGFDFTDTDLKPPRALSTVALQHGRYLFYIGDYCEFIGKCFVSLVILEIDADAREVRLLGEVENFASVHNGVQVDLVLRGNTVVVSLLLSVFDVSDRKNPKFAFCAAGAQGTDVATADRQCQEQRLADLPGVISAPPCAAIAGCRSESTAGSAASLRPTWIVAWSCLAAIAMMRVAVHHCLV